MTGEELLQQALTTFRARRASYGKPDKYFHKLAARWSAILGVEVTASQVAICMIELKLLRLEEDPANYDSIVDIAGYAACLSEVTK